MKVVPCGAGIGSTVTLAYDWIEFTGESESINLTGNYFLYSVEKQNHGTPYFQELYKVSTIVHGETLEFATLEIKPRPSFLSDNLVKVKLHNRFCYTPNLVESVKSFCREFGIRFKHYTRLDYAIDFQEVNQFGDNIQLLLHRFASKELILKGRSMTVHSSVSQYNGITWGARSSGLSMTLYNKTTELNKKSGKPWITGLWLQAGFDFERPVYRLEFSTKNPRYDIVSHEGETLGSYADIEFLDRFNEYLNYLYNNYFQVGIAEPGKRFSRLQRYSPLALFVGATQYRPQRSCIKPQSTNIKKTVVKNIVLEAMFLQRKGKKVEASYAWQMAMHYVDRYSLNRWFDKTFDRLCIKSTHMTHYDIITSESIKYHNLKQGTILN